MAHYIGILKQTSFVIIVGSDHLLRKIKQSISGLAIRFKTETDSEKDTGF